MSESLLIARNLSKVVRTEEAQLHILNNVSVALARGESLAIVGSSGSGKSTLLGLLAGLDLPSHGEVLIAGKNLNLLNEDQRAALRAQMVGFVFQSFQLLPSLTAVENVMLPLELAGQSGKSARAEAAQLLDRVGLAARLNHYPRQLSGGEQQRVALARAFASKPAILFADEPTGNLDTKTGAHIIDLLFNLNAEAGTTLVLVTHEQRLAERCSQHLQLEAGSSVLEH
ncbi:ABC transporter ATP-binding protein [Atopomonas sediminilitoris]|uniref:ABC transporter ATP-binding protein n=1 Tax=Atopomonas sediminilitoris TaxID=2919919 RepID=UPI001F4F01C6|nr:ATP-binding cassette domain-containing protein [Atopomonas sediminilitoris]MCJ8169037.1 ATP-binding cassette domain-containing protein [Atopomonas sediminilitoris]